MARQAPYELTKPPNGIGQIVDLFQTNCAPNPWIWIGAVGWAFISMFLSLLSPSWKDWVKWSSSTEFELRWSGIEGRDGRSWLHGGRWILEGAEEKLPVSWVKGFGFLFEIGEVVDAAAFWYFVGETLGEGILAGTSLILQASPCQRQANYNYFFSNTNISNLPFTNDWAIAGAWINPAPGSYASELGAFIDIPQGVTAEIMIHMAYANGVTGEPVAFNMRIRDLDTDDIVSQNNWNPETADPNYSNFARVRPFGPTTRAYHFVVEVQIVGTVPLIATEPHPNHIAVQWA